ncbi:MAG: ATP-binding protein [Roseobacter sp.]|nr:ATP-binding protein [Roseobacter sp.]
MQPFDLEVQSGQMAAREALAQFLEALGPLNLDVEETGTIELVLAEVLNNIVEHAYPENAPAGPIAIHCAHQDDGLLVQIKDKGKAMPDGKLPLGEVASLDVELDDMPEGGFGWFLIQHLARDVTYARVEDENHLNMRLAIGLC